MKKTKLFIIWIFALCISSCTSQTEELSQVPTQNDIIAFHDSLKILSNETKGIIDSLAEKSFNYNTSNTRAQKLDEDSLDYLISKLSIKTQDFLIENGINTDSIYIEGGNKEQLAYIGLLLLDYEKLSSIPQTRASIRDCVLSGAGLSELFSNKVLSKRAVMRIIIKAGLKRAVPYLGWALFISETAACLAGY